jgi:Mg-chelatase subunit ChlD
MNAMRWQNIIRRGKDIQKASGSEDTHVSVSQKGIEIRHEGKPVSSGALTGYVYLLVDCSSSMEGNKLKKAKKGTLNFAKDALGKGYFTGLIKFDSSARLVCEPFKDITNLEKKLVGLEIGDTTHMAKAINLAHELLKEMSGARVMVIVTDGMPNGPGDPIASLDAGQNAKRNRIDIIAIGTDDADQEFLKRLASRSDLGMKVPSKQLEKTITSSAKMLPPGDKRIAKR